MMYVCNVLVIISDENPCKITSNNFFNIEDNSHVSCLALSNQVIKCKFWQSSPRLLIKKKELLLFFDIGNLWQLKQEPQNLARLSPYCITDNEKF